MFVWFSHIRLMQMMILYQSHRRIFRDSRWRPVAILHLWISYMWHRDSSNISNPPNYWARIRCLAMIICFEVILMSNPRWLPISRYEIVKTSDEKCNNATKVVSVFTYPIILSCTTNPLPCSTTNPCARPTPYMIIIKTWLQYDTLQRISTYRNSGNKP